MTAIQCGVYTWGLEQTIHFLILLSVIIECVTLSKTLAFLHLSFPKLQDGCDNNTYPTWLL